MNTMTFLTPQSISIHSNIPLFSNRRQLPPKCNAIPTSTTTQRKRGRSRLTLSDLRTNAAQRGGYLLSESYSSAHGQLTWKCCKGHVWRASACNIRGAKSWCPTCATKSRKRTKQDMDQIASKFDGSCLSDEYLGELVKLHWQCKNGHTFWMAPNNINRSVGGARKPSWCRICSKSERRSMKLKFSHKKDTGESKMEKSKMEKNEHS